jgi:chromosomal replication initiation ATPase DnaA
LGSNIHNSIRNEVLIKFNLNDLHIKASYGFVIDLLSSNFKEHNIYLFIYLFIHGVVGSGKSQIIKAISVNFF